MYKIMILADSDANPRSFPPQEAFPLEETYPYLIREQFKDSIFWQLSYGNLTTSQLTNQPLGYLTHWKPDIIIVHSGIADCRPEAFSDFQRDLIMRFSGPLFRWLKKYVYHPDWIRRRQVYRVSKSSFKRTIKRFKLAFPESKIFWLEIATGPKYEEARPGVERRMVEYNEIIKEIYGEDLVPVREKVMEVDGYNAVDHGHLNKRGHRAVAEVLIERMRTYLESPKEALSGK